MPKIMSPNDWMVFAVVVLIVFVVACESWRQLSEEIDYRNWRKNMADEKIRVDDYVWSDQFKSKIRVLRIDNDETWWFELPSGKCYKAKDPLHEFKKIQSGGSK